LEPTVQNADWIETPLLIPEVHAGEFDDGIAYVE